MTTSDSTAQATTKKTGTRYHIFEEKQTSEGVVYVPAIANVEAASGTAAIRKHVDDPSREPINGTFVAVPAKSFQPLKVRIEQQRVVKIT